MNDKIFPQAILDKIPWGEKTRSQEIQSTNLLKPLTLIFLLDTNWPHRHRLSVPTVPHPRSPPWHKLGWPEVEVTMVATLTLGCNASPPLRGNGFDDLHRRSSKLVVWKVGLGFHVGRTYECGRGQLNEESGDLVSTFESNSVTWYWREKVSMLFWFVPLFMILSLILLIFLSNQVVSQGRF